MIAVPYGAFVDPACPLDWSHPLNQGLIADYTIIPNSGWSRGNTLRDLVRGAKNPSDGTLTAGPTWAGAKGRPGGFGATAFDGSSNSYIALPTGKAVPKGTASFWVYPRAAGFGAIFNLDNLDSTGSFKFFLASGGTGITTFAGDTSTQLTTAGSIGTNTWGHFAATWDGTTVSTYLNGKPDTAWSNATTQTITSNWSIGMNIGRSGQFLLNGLVDGVLLHERVLPAAQVQALYQESRRGNPERLRWVSTRAWSIPSGQPDNTANVWLFTA